MAEGSLYDRELAALAIKQARGDLVEAIFLLRAYRTTLPRFGSADPVNTAAMLVRRRISAIYKDVPGGQILGPTFDYTHRLLDDGAAERNSPDNPAEAVAPVPPAPELRAAGEAAAREETCPKALDFLEKEGLLAEERVLDGTPGDLTRQALEFPAARDIRLQNLARGDEGLLLALAYSTQRGYGSSHPFAGEIRMGEVSVYFFPEELGFPVLVGEIVLTECESVSRFAGKSGQSPVFTRGYGLAFGESERKAISMALVDRALQSEELGEEKRGVAQDAEFVLYHSDNVEASGFVQHLKLPHYVDFQAELEYVRSRRRKRGEGKDAPERS
jgi:alpha-D-ribose 1-methylphosphonate 5-triphosphate synthase subunit PhnI